MTRSDRIAAALSRHFSPTRLVVLDESARHAGHAGAGPDGETHFHVTLTSAAFRGQGRLARTRAVNLALADEFVTGLHALSLTLKSDEEDGA